MSFSCGGSCATLCACLRFNRFQFFFFVFLHARLVHLARILVFLLVAERSRRLARFCAAVGKEVALFVSRLR